MKFLFVSLLSPYSSKHKGDFKLLQQRANYLLKDSNQVTLTYFRIDPFRFRSSSSPLRSLDNNLNIISINVPLLPVIICLFFLSPYHLATRKPIQTLLSRVYSFLSQGLLDTLYKSYESVHFFHVRCSYLFRHSTHIPKPLYELIDSYALNLSRRQLLSSNPFTSLLYNYEASAIEAEEYEIINHSLAPKVLFVSHLDAQYYRTRSERLPDSVPLYTQYHTYKHSCYSPGSPIHIGFFGNLNYHPNIYAVQSLIELSNYNHSLDHPLPLNFHVGGRFLPRQLRLQLATTSFTVTSPIISIPEYLDHIDVCIFYMRAGSGMQSKLLEAASNSCLIITSQQPYEAIFSNPNQPLTCQPALVASNIIEVHRHLRNIYTGSTIIDPITKCAHSHIVNNYSLESVAAMYLNLLPY